MRREPKVKGAQKGGGNGSEQGGEKGVAEGASPVRRRTLERMQRLLAAGVAAGGLGAGCWDSDPAPPPLDCGELSTSAALHERCAGVEAFWVQLEYGWRIRVRVSLSSWECGRQVFEIAGDPLLEGGALHGLVRAEAELSFLLQPHPGAENVDVDVPLTCDAHALDYRFRLAVGGFHDQGQDVPVTPLD